MAVHCTRRLALICAAALSLLAAARGLGQVAQPATPERLVALLVGEDLQRSSQSRRISDTDATRAAGALVELGDMAVPALVQALASKTPLQRRNAVFVLSRIDTQAALAARLLAARNDDNQARSLALGSLPVYTHREAHRIAWEALSDADRDVQRAAMMAFVTQRPQEKPYNTERYYAAQKIAELLKDEELRPDAAWVLGHLDSNVAAQPLLAALTDPRPLVRYQIIESLGKIGDKHTTVGVSLALRDADRNVRREAAWALGELRDLRGTPALVAVLTDPESSVRRDAADALGKIGDWRAVTPLLPLLEDPEEDVCRCATWALAAIGDRQAIPALIAALERSQARSEPAADALGKLGDPRAIPALGKYLAANPDSDPAAQALARIRHPDAVAELARVASTIKSLAARRGLRAIADVGLDFSPPETVAQWWQENREAYLRQLPVRRP